MPVSRLAAGGAVRPAWWRPRSPRYVQIDARGCWRWQLANGTWCIVWPDTVHTGLGGRWLTIAGAVVGSQQYGAKRARCTFWADSVAPDVWRSLCIAAQWRLQQGKR